MPQSLSQVILHVVFSTKDRRPSFFWQGGYCDFSIGWSQLEELVRYIDRQEQHHRTQTFQEEYRHLLQKYHVEFDERYVWD
jgi:hypothetical protein